MPYKIVFRGDSRSPIREAIFSRGFQKRDPTLDITPRLMFSEEPGHEGEMIAPDILPESAVCVSARISAAALFPLNPDPGPYYLYMMALPVSNTMPFNTHALQVYASLASPPLRLVMTQLRQAEAAATVRAAFADAAATATARAAADAARDAARDAAARAVARAADVMWPLYAQELAVDRVSAGEIIACVQFTHVFIGGVFQAGGQYTLATSIIPNPRCTVPVYIRGAALAFLRNEIADHRTEPLPTGTSGYHRSELYVE